MSIIIPVFQNDYNLYEIFIMLFGLNLITSFIKYRLCYSESLTNIKSLIINHGDQYIQMKMLFKLKCRRNFEYNFPALALYIVDSDTVERVKWQ